MRDRALAWLIACRGDEAAESWLAALPDARRERVSAAAAENAEAGTPPDAELVRVRSEQLAAIEKRGAARFGSAWREANPSVKRFLWTWVSDDGEDS